jgi:hypothetical protein
MSEMFNGMNVITSVYLVQNGYSYERRLSWHERLFSRPWRPFTKTKTETPKVPYQGALKLNATTLLMHPATLSTLQQNIRREYKR